MKSLKDKMLDYEASPPSDSWLMIAATLDKVDNNRIGPPETSRAPFYLSIAAAVAAILVLSVFVWTNNSNNKNKQTADALQLKEQLNSNGLANAANDKITVPKTNEEQHIPGSPQSSENNKKKIDKAGFDSNPKKYITVSGPQGQPVRISSKVISLIVSSDDQYPPNTVWNAKVDKWKAIMRANTLAPTTANFLDIVELTHALKITNP